MQHHLDTFTGCSSLWLRFSGKQFKKSPKQSKIYLQHYPPSSTAPVCRPTTHRTTYRRCLRTSSTAVLAAQYDSCRRPHLWNAIWNWWYLHRKFTSYFWWWWYFRRKVWDTKKSLAYGNSCWKRIQNHSSPKTWTTMQRSWKVPVPCIKAIRPSWEPRRRIRVNSGRKSYPKSTRISLAMGCKPCFFLSISNSFSISWNCVLQQTEQETMVCATKLCRLSMLWQGVDISASRNIRHCIVAPYK